MCLIQNNKWKHSVIRYALSSIPHGGVLVDVGCGNPPQLINTVRHTMDFCIGIDSETHNSVIGNVETKHCVIKKKLPVESDLANVVTGLSVLEHLDYPRAILQEIYRILKPGGVLLLTAPSPFYKLLNKSYYTIKQLTELLNSVGFRNVNCQLFQLGSHIFVHAVK